MNGLGKQVAIDRRSSASMSESQAVGYVQGVLHDSSV